MDMPRWICLGYAGGSIQEVGREEGAGNGGSRNWIEDVRWKSKKEAQSFVSSRLPPNLQTSDPNKAQQPSIFKPRCQVGVPVALAPPVHIVARTPPLVRTGGAAASRRGLTGGNVIVAAVGPYDLWQSGEGPPSTVIPRDKKSAIVELLARREFGLDTGTFLQWALDKYDTASRYYESDTLTMSPQELAEMFLRDGCLVVLLVFLLRKSRVRPYPLCLAADISVSEPNEPAQEFNDLSADIFQHMKQIKLDLLLLGNQIPFFVLAELHRRLKETLFLGIKPSIQLEELALSCFDDILPIPNTNNRRRPKFPDPVHHLLHLFHWSRVPQVKDEVDPRAPPLLGEPESDLPCATWFEDSCISFSRHAAAPGTLHMAFERNMLGARGLLRVPVLHINKNSDLVFHNLIAFEQSHLGCGFAVTTYSICMARLLQSEADAKLLKKKGILAHTHETDKEIVDLFRGLADEYRDYRHAHYSQELLQLCKHVEEHHHSRAARAFKWVRLQCFPRQTVTFFVILGALISIATLINTIVSVYRFYHPAKQ
jgi:hypothetical protein